MWANDCVSRHKCTEVDGLCVEGGNGCFKAEQSHQTEQAEESNLERIVSAFFSPYAMVVVYCGGGVQAGLEGNIEAAFLWMLLLLHLMGHVRTVEIEELNNKIIRGLKKQCQLLKGLNTQAG